MGIFSDVGKLFGEVTGFGGHGNPNPRNTDPEAYRQLYEEALGQIQGVGTDKNSMAMRGGIEDAAIGAIGDLENQAAGRKANFMEDMSRGFAADTQNLARARGGTGTLAQVLSPSGGMYDAQARATSRGLNDLYSRAVSDIGSLQGVQGNLYGQDFNKAQAAAGVRTNELGQRRGVLNQNNENIFNSEQAGRERRLNTLGGIVKSAGSLIGGGAA